ncbi:non-structural maintenance of chromosomes element 1-like protein, partial [Dinothrombium tinctorium]
MRNNLEERLKYNIDLLAHSIYNNGQEYRDLYHCRQIIEIEPSAEIWTKFELQPEQYIGNLTTFATVEFQAIKVSLENPKMKLTWYLSEDGSALNINATFKNPLNKTLTNCKLKISGKRLNTRVFPIKNFAPFQSSSMNISIPTKEMSKRETIILKLITHDMDPITEVIRNFRDASNAESDVDAIVCEVNNALKPYRMQIAKGVDEHTAVEYYAFVNLVDTEITRLSSLYKKEQYEYFKKIVSTLFESDYSLLSRNAAVNLCHSLEENNIKMKVTDADSLLDKWIDEKYFALTEDRKQIYFGVRSILEMQPYFKQHFPSNITECNLCKVSCIRGVHCPKCETKFHFHCASRCFQDNRKCAQCGHIWTQDLSSITNGDDSIEESSRSSNENSTTKK